MGRTLLQRRRGSWLRAASLRQAVLLALLGFVVACAAMPTVAAADVADRVARVVRESGMAANTSVIVYREADQRLLYQHRPVRRVTPASNQKLYTAAAVLQGLGPDHRFQTQLALQGTQRGSRFTGNVYLIGGGDPTLSTRTFARRNFGGHGANLALLTRALRVRGIEQVRGKLVVDESFLDRERYVRNWPAYFRYYETTALGALTVNQSYRGKTLGGRNSARQPAVRAGQVFLQLLQAHGITVSGGIRTGTTPASAARVGTVQSPPLSTIVAFMNRRSDNFTAEILLKDLGRIRRGAGTTRAGALAARQQLRGLGLSLSGLSIVDGSGLSSANRTSSRNIVDLLNILDRNEALDDPWLDSLAVSGRTGTLSRRLRRAPYRGRVRGKTGTLAQSSALSGYATRAATGERYGFSIVTYTPGRRVSWSSATRLQDRIASVLVR